MSTKSLDVYKAAEGGILGASLSRPVFVHSSFRASSTWLWAKLRALPNVTAYCEIFHELFAGVTVANMRDVRYTAWNSGHPACAPYFLEFMPLLEPSGGIKGFEPSMSFESFVPASGIDGELSAGEKSYLGGLILNAQSNGTIPVLTDTRSLGRAPAIKRSFDCTNILLYRNLFHQWGSYTAQSLAGNNYFVDAMNTALMHSHHDPVFKLLDEWFSDRRSDVQDIRLFQTFLLFHIYLLAANIDVSDILIDVNRIAERVDDRHLAEEALAKVTFAQIDLSDVRSTFEASFVPIDDPRAFRDELEQFVKIISASLRSPRAIAFADRVLTDSLREIESHRFYALKAAQLYIERGRTIDEKTRNWEGVEAGLRAELDELRADVENSASELERLEDLVSQSRSKCEQLDLQAAEANSNNSALRDRLEHLARERDQSAAEAVALAEEKLGLTEIIDRRTGELESVVGQLLSANDAQLELQRDVDRITAERNQLTEQFSSVSKEEAKQRSEINRIAAECNAMTLQLAETDDARSELKKANDALVVERIDISTALEGISAERRHLQAAVDDLALERDRLLAEMVEKHVERQSLESLVRAQSIESDELQTKFVAANEENDRLRITLAQVSAELQNAKDELKVAKRPWFAKR